MSFFARFGCFRLTWSRVSRSLGQAFTLSLLVSGSAGAVDPATPDPGTQSLYLEEVAVIGSKEAVKEIAGSAYFVDTKEIRTQNQTDINRVLRKVPGVYVREEDGFGLFPNISLRGVDPGRSQKVTVMEDGLLTAPAPYSAPGAYYSPNTARMDSIEVLKGSTTVRYGPHITGGVINYNSTLIPDQETYYSKTSFGSFKEIRNHTYFGNTFDTKMGKVGFLIENFHRDNDGFRESIATKNNLLKQDTGLNLSEQMLKVMWEPKTSKYQRFEVKFGHTKLLFNDGYLGQPESLFRQQPLERLDAARFDQMNTEHFRTYLRHLIELNADTRVVTTGYGNHFSRNWHKLASCNNINGVGSDDPSLGECLARPDGLALLSGQPGTSGRLDIRNNSRDYYLFGVQSVVDHHLTLGPTDHQMQFGIRYHSDQIRRFQSEEELTINANADVTGVNFTAPGSAGNRVQKTRALAVHWEDKIEWGRFTFTPGVRFEFIDQEFADEDKATPGPNLGNRQFDSFTIGGGGGSLNYNIADDSRHRADVFGGVIRGYSPPGPKGHIVDNIKPERSLGMEAGGRYHNNQYAFETELIYFRTDFQDLVVTGNVAAGAGDSQNVGTVLTQGIEFQVRYDAGLHRGWGFRNPWYFSMTYTDAEITSTNSTSGSATDDNVIFAGAKKGNKVPYVPEVQFAFGTGIEWGKFGLHVDAQYVDDTFATANNSPLEINPTNGRADVRFGKIDSFFIVDLTMDFQIHKNVKLFTNFKNITNDTYLVTRLPDGPRPGLPFSMLGGLEFSLF